MKTRLTFEFDCPEEGELLRTQVHAVDLYDAIHEARQAIRSYLKRGEIAEETESILEEIRELLYVEGVE